MTGEFYVTLPYLTSLFLTLPFAIIFAVVGQPRRRSARDHIDSKRVMFFRFFHPTALQLHPTYVRVTVYT